MVVVLRLVGLVEGGDDGIEVADTHLVIPLRGLLDLSRGEDLRGLLLEETLAAGAQEASAEG